MAKDGGAIVGSPGTVRDQVNCGGRGEYFIGQFSFGDSHQEVLHSAGIFAREMIAAPQERTVRAV